MSLSRRSLLIATLAAAALLTGCESLTPPLTHAALALDRGRSGVERHEIVLSDGTRVVYLEGGQGEPLVLAHGFGADKDNFTRVARWLVPHYRVIVPDLVGFGESSHPADADYRYAAQAERLRAFAQALGLSRVHLGGSSMGGGIAMSYAVQHPQEVASLWLIDTAGLPEAPTPELRALLERGDNPLMVRKEEDFERLMAFTMNERPWIPGFVRDMMARERIANQALEDRIFEQIFADSLSEVVTGLQVPTLITWGARDRSLNVATAEILHAKLPNSQVDVMPGIGHLPMVERPGQSAETYLRFRAGLAGNPMVRARPSPSQTPLP